MRLAAIHANGSKTFSRFISAGGFFDCLGKKSVLGRFTIDFQIAV